MLFCGNCMDLKMYKDNTFDITLVLGPLYHLFKDSDITKALKEAIRVTKKGGKLFIAYITSDSVIMSYGLRKGNLKRLKEVCDDNWDIPKVEEEIFATFRIENFNKLIKKFNVKQIETIATDGIALQMQNYINKLNDEDFKIYIDYHLKNCRRKDLIGYSSHILEILRKE